MRIARQSPEDPIRAELFGIERLEQHAESLAAAQGVMRRSGRGRRLLQRVERNGRVLRDAYRVIANAIREERAITPAAEWLVDNFHVVDEQLREIHDDLPLGFYRKLPKLVEGPHAGPSTKYRRLPISYISCMINKNHTITMNHLELRMGWPDASPVSESSRMTRSNSATSATGATVRSRARAHRRHPEELQREGDAGAHASGGADSLVAGH